MPPAPILQIVADLYGVTVAELTGKRRFARLTIARQAAAWALRRSGLGVTETGEQLNQDHTTVIYSVRATEARIGTDGRLRDLAARIGHPLPAAWPWTATQLIALRLAA